MFFLTTELFKKKFKWIKKLLFLVWRINDIKRPDIIALLMIFDYYYCSKMYYRVSFNITRGRKHACSSDLTYSLTSTPNDRFFEKLFHGRFIYSQSYCQKSAERKSPKKYCFFFIFRFDAWPGIRTRPLRLIRQHTTY